MLSSLWLVRLLSEKHKKELLTWIYKNYKNPSLFCNILITASASKIHIHIFYYTQDCKFVVARGNLPCLDKSRMHGSVNIHHLIFLTTETRDKDYCRHNSNTTVIHLTSLLEFSDFCFSSFNTNFLAWNKINILEWFHSWHQIRLHKFYVCALYEKPYTSSWNMKILNF